MYFWHYHFQFEQFLLLELHLISLNEKVSNKFNPGNLISLILESRLGYGGPEITSTLWPDLWRALDISFTYEGVFYAHYDLDWDSYENFELVDYLRDADQKESACCGASFDEDIRRCGYCKESL